MDVRNCIKCGRIFNYASGQPICAQCKKDQEETFKEVRIYIRRNANASISEVAESCKVDVKQIRQWIREERLSFSAESSIGIECELCNATIRTGRFCEACKASSISNLDSAYKKENSAPVEKVPENDHKSQMRFLNKDR